MGEINHIGKVVAVDAGGVSVSVERSGACSNCENKKACMMLDSSNQIMKIKDPNYQNYKIGEAVNVSVNSALGLKAVLWAYVIPVIVLIASIAVSFNCFYSELLQVLFALISVALYYLILYFFRNRIEQKFNLTISKNNEIT